MKMIRSVSMLTVMAFLAGCAGTEPASRGLVAASGTVSVATKNAPAIAVGTPRYAVAKVDVIVPRSLRVSEANVFFPIADIVWHGDPLGDRYAQVTSVVSEGLQRGTQGMTSGRKVVVTATLVRFHALTEKTRYTIGGVHAIHFEMTVRDAMTGAVLEGPRLIKADVKGSGGQRAIAEEQVGRTQRVVITERLAQVIEAELSGPLPGNDAPKADGLLSQADVAPQDVALQ